MNQTEIGKLIAKARKEKGYTQQDLANLLFITDKAVSKWERGLSLPDSNMFLKIAHILDLDVEDLIPSNKLEKWSGYIKVNKKDSLYKEKLGSQTVLEHLISLFALLSIKDIFIDCADVNFIKALKLEKYGFNVKINDVVPSNRLICINDNFFLYGANLTRWLTSLMSLESNVEFYFKNKKIPLSIKCGNEKIIKHIGRGYIFSDISKQNLKFLNSFISTLSSLNGSNINSLYDIVSARLK